MRRWLIFVPSAAALFFGCTFFACTSSDDSDEVGTVQTYPCCTADDPVCGIQQDEAGACLACCHGDTCGFPPETDGSCPGPSIPDASPPCETSAQCAAGSVCAYPLVDLCTTQTVCVDVEAGPACDPGIVYCGCNGENVSCVVQGYTSGPVESFGACDAGFD